MARRNPSVGLRSIGSCRPNLAGKRNLAKCGNLETSKFESKNSCMLLWPNHRGYKAVKWPN
eukprot:6175688-Pleurochrysis_carterae.AAC.1